MDTFWDSLPVGPFANEAEVEARLVVPMLQALGYDDSDIAPKYPVVFREGRSSGRKPEADYVCFNGPTRSQDASLLVVEAKAPGESLSDGKQQCESYAANLRAPVLLLTDGLKLEIWQFQWTLRCEKALEVPVAALYASRGLIEQLVSKTALIDHCRLLKSPALTQMATDYGRYIEAELERTKKFDGSVSRTLHQSDFRLDSTSSTRLLDDYPRGAVIFAPSGYGKSTLAYGLLRSALEKRPGPAPPVFVPLPDLEPEAISINSFMHQRLAAHCPGVSQASFTHILRISGVVGLCDGFDRVSGQFRPKLNSELTNLLRDYPKMQIFIFSRGAARPSIDLPSLTLDRLSDEELVELEKQILGNRRGPAFLVSMMPRSLREICRNALLARLVFEYWHREQRFPQKLDYLFRSWIEALLSVRSPDAILSADMEEALKLLASATTASPITTREAASLLERRALKQTLLNDLIACDALRVSGSTVELQHEILADYLRASDTASLPEDSQLKKLETMSIPSGSLYPILLMSQLSSRPLQAALWRRFSEIDLEVYLDALRYRYDLSSEFDALATEELSQRCLEDLLDGIELPLEAFFSQIRAPVIEYLTRNKAPALAISGTLKYSRTWLDYGFRSDQGPRVRVGEPSWAQVSDRRGVNLERSGYRLDSGRLIGTTHLRDALVKLCEAQALMGGIVWSSERLTGRIRYLQREHGLGDTKTSSLEGLQRALQPHAEKWVATNGLGSEGFWISSLSDDIDTMLASGKEELDLWWLRLGWVEGALVQADAVLEKVLDEYFRRIQQAVAEVVQRTFPELTSKFSSFTALPLRVRTTVARSIGPWGYRRMWYTFLPVSSWSEAGADVEFADQPPLTVDGDSLVRQALETLGRSAVQYHISGSSPIPLFDAPYGSSRYPGSTSVTHQVCQDLLGDLKHIFSALPRQDA